MTDRPFKALIVEEKSKNEFQRFVGKRRISDLPDGELLVKVHYSSLNYKDALSATGNRGVTRKYPHTPGIDAVGVVEKSSHNDFEPEDRVVVTSYDLGMNTPGGFGQYIRVPGAWAVPLPDGLSMDESMVLGTAGFTAGMSVHFIEKEVSPDAGDILVTGATGGVGSIAVALLTKLGYTVTAVSGKPDAADFLTSLGAKTIIGRDAASQGNDQALLKTKWAGVVDTVGGDILAVALKSAKPWSVVTCCGLVASPDLPLNVFPFILRGVKLVGIDSQNCPMPLRKTIWQCFSDQWKLSFPEGFSKEISLEALDENIERILQGGQKGRVIVKLP